MESSLYSVANDSARLQPVWSAMPMTLACPYQSCSFCACRHARTFETAWVGNSSCNSIVRKTNAASAGCPIGTKKLWNSQNIDRTRTNLEYFELVLDAHTHLQKIKSAEGSTFFSMCVRCVRCVRCV